MSEFALTGFGEVSQLFGGLIVPTELRRRRRHQSAQHMTFSAGLAGTSLMEAAVPFTKDEVARNEPAPAPAAAMVSTRTFQGVVDRIDGDIAVVVLEDSNGNRYPASGRAEEFRASGILANDRFKMTVTNSPSESSVRLEKVFRRDLTAAELRSLSDEFEDF